MLCPGRVTLGLEHELQPVDESPSRMADSRSSESRALAQESLDRHWITTEQLPRVVGRVRGVDVREEVLGDEEVRRSGARPACEERERAHRRRRLVHRAQAATEDVLEIFTTSRQVTAAGPPRSRSLPTPSRAVTTAASDSATSSTQMNA